MRSREGLKELYQEIKDRLKTRFRGFERISREGDEKELFAELAFCILTPQSRARSCGDAVDRLREKGLLARGSYGRILKELEKVRFKYKKARFLMEARNACASGKRDFLKRSLLALGTDHERRTWLVKNIKGLGFKEASHYLRNIGLGKDLAILDRHVLRNLAAHRVIPRVPDSLTLMQYLEIEEKMRTFAKEIGIPMAHLDLVFLFQALGDIYK